MLLTPEFLSLCLAATQVSNSSYKAVAAIQISICAVVMLVIYCNARLFYAVTSFCCFCLPCGRL